MDGQQPSDGSVCEFVPAARQKSMETSHTKHNRNEQTQTLTAVKLPQEMEDELRKITDEFTVDTAKLRDIVEHFGRELEEGLQKPHQNIAMHPTWVFGMPTGQETGQYLTIDLGGTNLRVCWITLKGRGHATEIEQDTIQLPAHIKTGTADELWGLLANCLAAFLHKHDLGGTADAPLPLGLTFSYPVAQTAIDRGTLVTWTKGFAIAGVEGHDVVLQLRAALARRRLPVRVVALVNDTVGALVASAYADPRTIVGAIFGTGSNAAYVDAVGAVPKLAGCGLPPQTPIAINCEYGAFDNARAALPRTRFDAAVDAASPKPGEQAFEKMSAGLYLGELFRRVLVELGARPGGGLGGGFRGAPARRGLQRLADAPYALDTALLSALENDDGDGDGDGDAALARRRAQFEAVLGFAPAPEELELARRVARAITARGARLSACGVAAICKMKAMTAGNVAADGSVANKHPHFKARWKQALAEALEWPADRKEDPIHLTSAEDGSGIGAAIICAMTMKNMREGRLMGPRDGGQ